MKSEREEIFNEAREFLAPEHDPEQFMCHFACIRDAAPYEILTWKEVLDDIPSWAGQRTAEEIVIAIRSIYVPVVLTVEGLWAER
jgi:hypothetical protein